MSRKPKAQEPEPEPTAMDLLDPQPGPAAAPLQEPVLPPAAPPEPRRPRRKGPVELAVLRDLRTFPDDLRKGAIAAAAQRLAMELDAGIVLGRDAAGHAREIRQCITTLREFAPGEVKGDSTDEVRARREKRLAQEG